MHTQKLEQTRLRATPPGEEPLEQVLLGRYRVLGSAGSGGFGTVCTCWDTRLQRRVAIKRIPIISPYAADNPNASTAEEVLSEARTACLLAHPNIVTVFDFEVDDRFAYLVMEYVDGLTVAELLQRVEGGTLTHQEVAHILSSVADALAFAHENGVLHLDIKPTNIMIDRAGTVKLADFGMATLASAAGYGGARGGTVGYMPPEQIEGDLVDERTDIFSLAVVIWQALAGKSPFEAPSAEASLAKIVRGPKPPLSKTDPALAGIAEDALLQALAPDPQDRMADITDFAADVLVALGEPEDGASSLRELVEQDEEDEPEADVPWSERHLPFDVRFPWGETAIVRIFTAVLVFALVRLAAFPLLGEDPETALTAGLVAAGVAALWPPAGAVLVGTAVTAAIATVNATNASFPTAGIFALVAAAWWLFAGRRDHLGSSAFLLPAATPFPFAGVALAIYALEPAEALATGMVGYLFGTFFSLIREAGFAATPLVAAVAETFIQPTVWLGALACGLAALVGSALVGRGSVGAGIAGQAIGCAVVVAGLLYAAHMENGGIWAPPDAPTIACAVSLTICMCIATVLRGPLEWDQEGEDS